MLSLHCSARAFSRFGAWGLLSSWGCSFSLQRLLSLQSTGSGCVGGSRLARGLQSTGSVVVAHGPSCSAACGIVPDQGWNPCPLRWQADSHPLNQQGSPGLPLLRILWLHWAHWIIQDNFPSSISFTSPRCKVSFAIYIPQILKNRTWTSLELIILPTIVSEGWVTTINSWFISF